MIILKHGKDRNKYYSAVKTQLESNIFNHSLAVEACMGGIYDYLQSLGELNNNDEPRIDWTLAGLLHDIDYGGETKSEHPKRHAMF